MIQFNLLPDIKLEYVRVQRIKHTVISASLIAAGTAFAVFALLFITVNVVQKKSMNDLTKDIKTYSTELKNTPDLDKILTIQNQLGALPNLHAQKVASSRTFKYIEQVTSPDISLTDYTNDFDAKTVSITGVSPSLDKVNTYVDTLKYTTYKDGADTDKKAFSNVVMSQFTKTPLATTFTITANYEPALYDNTSNVALTVPNRVSTSSVVNLPTVLFKQAPTSGNN
ncbi:MAG TPA: hypothetical protein VF575_05555 [Candidatus Saccharimonadales bacterium]|jgi:hypothetical protein